MSRTDLKLDLIKACSRITAAVVALLIAASAEAQIATQNAGVTSPEIPTLRESISYQDAKDYQSLRLNHEFLMGLDPTLELRLSVPTVLSQDVRFRNGAGNRTTKQIAGLGDTNVALKKSLYQTDEILESTRWAVLANMVVPTGDEDRTSGGVELPRRLQLGSGSWGLGAGTAFTLIRDRHRFSAETTYLHHTRGDGFRPGPKFDLNLAYWFRMTPAVFEPGLRQVEVRPVLEFLSHYRFSSRSSAGRLRDDGWNVSVAPGLQVYPRTNLLFEFNVEVPVFQSIDDALGHRRWGATFAVKFLF